MQEIAVNTMSLGEVPSGSRKPTADKSLPSGRTFLDQKPSHLQGNCRGQSR